MSRYFVYILKQRWDNAYVGSTTKPIDRLRKHKQDKEFDSAIYCELPNKKLMLEVEGFIISKLNPPINRVHPNFSITELPPSIVWKEVDLTFLQQDTVDWDHGFYVDTACEYVCLAMGELGIPPTYLFYDLKYKIIRGKPVAVFDGSGLPISEFIKTCGFNREDEYVKAEYTKQGIIPLEVYERSIRQFD